MKLQHQVYLSLGSNLGDRQNNLQMALDAIHQKVATVILVSSVFESASWGFESGNFYNCVVQINTHLPPLKLLKKLLKIETQLGRTRDNTKQYQARIIDIDIVSYGQEIVNIPNLQIPHAFVAQRNFVLLPLQEIAPNWVDATTNKTVAELIALQNDTPICQKIGVLDQPMRFLDLSKYNYIAIEGNIGAGKTTLATKIAEDFNAKIVLERFADNPFLPKFYKDQNRYAFPLEMSFLADRYQQISDDLAQFDLFKDFIVADYHIFKSLIFAKVTLAEDEYRLYKKLFDIIYKEIPKPDLYIYLYQNTDRLLQNIKKRGRNYEQDIPAEYLEKINSGYLDYIKTQKDLKVLVVDVSTFDFVKKQEDYIFILNQVLELSI